MRRVVCALNSWFPEDERVQKLSYFDLYFNYTVKVTFVFERLLRDLADYLILFINPKDLEEFKKLEKNYKEGLADRGDVSETTYGSYKIKKVRSAEIDKEGNLTLDSGKKIHMDDIIKQIKED